MIPTDRSSLAVVSRLGVFALLTLPIFGQGVPHDWTHQHVIYSNSDSAEDSIKNPRLAIQTLSKAKGKAKGNGQDKKDQSVDESLAPITGLSPNSNAKPKPKPPAEPKGDWSYFLGNTSGAGTSASAYPATFAADFTTQSCSDIAIFTINKAGGTNQPSIVAFKDLYTSGAVAATALGTFTANSISGGQTITVNGTTLTASSPASATGTITVAASYCAANGQAVTINGTSLTTNATAASGTVTHNNNSSGTAVIAGVTYTMVTTLGATANSVKDGGTGSGGRANSAQNLRAAINNNSSQCGSAAPCFANVSAANPSVTSPSTSGDVTNVAAPCAGASGNFALTTPTGNLLSSVSNGTNGTTSGSNFALPNPVSNTGLAANINSAITNASVSGLTSNSAPSNVVNLTATAGSSGNQTITTTIGSGVTVSGMSGGNNGSSTFPNFQYWSGAAAASTTQVATNLAAAITSISGVNATSSGSTVTAVAETAGTAGNSIVLATPGFTGFTWASSTLIGGSAAGTCNSGAGPTIAWAYRGTSTPVTTSPVLSLAGNKVAFVEQGTTAATLHILKFATGDGSQTGGTFTTANPSVVTNFGACGVGNCMINFSYTSPAAANTNSSPFYSYAEDAIYVGDDLGKLYRIAPIFNGGGTPPAVSWSTTVSSFALKSPVLDTNRQTVLVADTGGVLRAVSTIGAHAIAGTTVNAGNTGVNVINGPILDISTGKMLAFISKDNATTNAIVLQANIADLTSQVKATIGTALATVPVNLGQLDNNYFTAADPSFGALYTCGNPNGAPSLYRIGFDSAGVMSTTAKQGPALATAAANCSPMSEVFNSGTTPGTDWLLAGVTASCGFGISSSGCVDAFNITGWQPSTSYAVGQLILDSNMNIQRVTAITTGTSGSSTPTWNATQFTGTTTDSGVTWTNMGQLLPSGTFAENGGTSGIVIDDIGTGPHNSNLYFTTLSSATCGTSGGGNISTCAVNLTQAGLH